MIFKSGILKNIETRTRKEGRKENDRWKQVFKGNVFNVKFNFAHARLLFNGHFVRCGIELFTVKQRVDQRSTAFAAGSRRRSRWAAPFRGNWTDSSQGLVAGMRQGWYRRVTFTKWLRAIFARERRRTLHFECQKNKILLLFRSFDP